MGLETFRHKGFAFVPVDKAGQLDELRGAIFDHAKTLVPGAAETKGTIDSFFNQFHRHGLSGADLNNIRMTMVGFCSKVLRAHRKVFDVFEKPLVELLGPDIVAQKTVNVVIQPPGDRDQVHTHRDAPLNSNFEVVVWLPLVNCYGTKTMFVCDKATSLQGLTLLKEGKPYEEFTRFSETRAVSLVIPYGTALFFAAGLVHGCPVNVENETRWSLNIRYKSLFSPYASKGLAEFFEVLPLSSATQVALDFERLEHERG